MSAALHAWIRALDGIKTLDDAAAPTLPGLLDRLAEQHGERPALLGEAGEMSYRALAAAANRMARWAVAQGLVAGDVVALLMANGPDYVATWLGLTRAGCTVALLNTNLRAEGLLHSLHIAGARHCIVGAGLAPALAAIADRLPQAMPIWLHGESEAATWPLLAPQIEPHDPAPLDPAIRALPGLRDRALLIYTSGTTGAPKAANVTHRRIMEWSLWFAGMMNIQPEDRLYNCLPMYHSVGGVVAVGALLVKGGSVLIRPRFSASRFWDDVVDGGCTIFQYIGELCRYLTTSKPHPKERQHRLRLACGNGMQGDVWQSLQTRFAIPDILEFYAATEGSVSLYNCEGKPGAIGRVPPFLSHRFPIGLIRCDAESGAPLRGADGLCIACATEETGEAIGRIDETTRPFDGYTDAAAGQRKLLRDVFAKGDGWFRTGDLMRKDAAGFYYFVDRIGDTFRWKGENVATTEVAAVLRACPGVTDSVVYGVAVAGHEGRAGMAAITTDDAFSLAQLHTHLQARLPGYAQPLFVRLCRTLALTGTFKLTKTGLVDEGYTNTDDPVWFNDRGAQQFIPCDAALVAAIGRGAMRV